MLAATQAGLHGWIYVTEGSHGSPRGAGGPSARDRGGSGNPRIIPPKSIDLLPHTAKAQKRLVIGILPADEGRRILPPIFSPLNYPAASHRGPQPAKGGLFHL